MILGRVVRRAAQEPAGDAAARARRLADRGARRRTAQLGRGRSSPASTTRALLIALAGATPWLLGVYVSIAIDGYTAVAVTRGALGERLNARGVTARTKGREHALVGWGAIVIGGRRDRADRDRGRQRGRRRPATPSAIIVTVLGTLLLVPVLGGARGLARHEARVRAGGPRASSGVASAPRSADPGRSPAARSTSGASSASGCWSGSRSSSRPRSSPARSRCCLGLGGSLIFVNGGTAGLDTLDARHARSASP